MSAELELCLQMFGWRRSSPVDQYLRNGDNAQPEIVFSHEDCNAQSFALNPLRDHHREIYAAWGYYDEGTLTEWGDDEATLLAFLTRLERDKLPGNDEG